MTGRENDGQQINYDMLYDFTMAKFIDFMMIQSNVNAKLENGEMTECEVRAWMSESLSDIFESQTRTLCFAWRMDMNNCELEYEEIQLYLLRVVYYVAYFSRIIKIKTAVTKGNNIDKSNIIQDDKKKRVPRLDNSRTVTNSLLKKIILDRSITVNCNFDKIYI